MSAGNLIGRGKPICGSAMKRLCNVKRKVRMPDLIEEYTRERLLICAERRWRSAEVIGVLADVMMLRGIPERLCSGNGPECAPKEVQHRQTALRPINPDFDCMTEDFGQPRRERPSACALEGKLRGLWGVRLSSRLYRVTIRGRVSFAGLRSICGRPARPPKTDKLAHD
jgi:hypothetical protein